MTPIGNDVINEIQRRFAPIIAISQSQTHEAVQDSTLKYSIRTVKGELFVTVSNSFSPLMVKRAVERQREIKSHLSGVALGPIEVPLFEGHCGIQSYAVWRKRLPLSTNRLMSKIQRSILAPRVYRWLKEVAKQTAAPADPSKLAANALRLQEIAAMPIFIKAAAEKAGNAFLSGRIPAIQAVQHSDLWIGNVLIAPSGFIVVDWPGARMDGSPFFDLMKFSLSVRTSKRTLNREIASTSKVLSCNVEYAPAYVLSGLGALYAELEHMPERNFLELCRQNMSAMSAALS